MNTSDMQASDMQGARVTIMAGGTGGHVFPALAVADRLTELGCSISWVGTPRGIENRVVPEAGYELSQIPISGLRGKGLLSLLLAPFQLIRALVASLKLLGRIKPHLVLGFGGFVAGPVGLAARIRGDRLAIHEQNARAGTTNKILARWADRVMTGFPEVLDKGVFVGNPVRAEMQQVSAETKRSESDMCEELKVLVLGGSQGARSLNQMLPTILGKISAKQALSIRHQCGARWLEETREQYLSASAQAEVIPFIEDMAEAYSWADIVICRSGAMTVSEVAFMAQPALFIPFPYAIDDHQKVNAQWLCELGAAEMVLESDIENVLLSTLERLLTPAKLKSMGKAAGAAAKPQATEEIINICKELVDVD